MIDCLIKKVSVALLVVLFFAGTASGQVLALSTNVVDYVQTGGLNVEASYALQRHWSVGAGMKYDGRGYQKQQLYSLGGRYWPWHIYSGWWLGAKMQYQEFSSAERVTYRTSEGDRIGAGASAGYSRMIGPHFNIDLGLGFWYGSGTYVRYSCPNCGSILSRGSQAFFLPNDILLALSYIF